MGITISAIFASAAIVLFGAGIFASFKNYEKRFRNKFSIKNMFPFEINYEGKFVDNFLGNCLLCLSALITAAFYATFDSSHDDGVAIFVLIAGVFSAALNCLLYFVPFKHLKTHIATQTFAFVFAFMSAGSTFLLNLFYFKQYQNIANLIAMILSGIIGLFIVAMIVNPKLTLKIQGVEGKDEQGNVVYHRPKWIMIAFTEWVNIFALLLNQISVILFVASIH